jgi:hypothetical protein
VVPVWIAQKDIGIPYAELVFLHPVVSVGHVVHSGAFGVLNIDTLFSCSGGMSKDSTKNVMGHVKMNYFHVMHSVQNVDALFFMLGWDWYGFDKRRGNTRYAEPMFLDPVGYAGHVVHSDAYEARNVDALLFMLGWVVYGFYKMRDGTPYAKLVSLHLMGYASHIVHCGVFKV